jgi:DNA polymerase elongation subunit (family B)
VRSRPSNIVLRPAKPANAKRILDFDIESISAGFEDPDWVPMHMTAIAWSWLDEDKVTCRTLVDYAKTVPDFLQVLFTGCRPLLAEFVAVYNQADIVTGHNINRFDVPALNAELMRLSLPPLQDKPRIDTMRLRPKTKGFKKGQDVLSVIFNLPAEKKALNWAEWKQAYATPGWPTIRERCAGDVVQHKLLLRKLMELGYLK